MTTCFIEVERKPMVKYIYRIVEFNDGKFAVSRGKRELTWIFFYKNNWSNWIDKDIIENNRTRDWYGNEYLKYCKVNTFEEAAAILEKIKDLDGVERMTKSNIKKVYHD